MGGSRQFIVIHRIISNYLNKKPMKIELNSENGKSHFRLVNVNYFQIFCFFNFPQFYL